MGFLSVLRINIRSWHEDPNMNPDLAFKKLWSGSGLLALNSHISKEICEIVCSIDVKKIGVLIFLKMFYYTFCQYRRWFFNTWHPNLTAEIKTDSCGSGSRNSGSVTKIPTWGGSVAACCGSRRGAGETWESENPYLRRFWSCLLWFSQRSWRNLRIRKSLPEKVLELLIVVLAEELEEPEDSKNPHLRRFWSCLLWFSQRSWRNLRMGCITDTFTDSCRSSSFSRLLSTCSVN